MEGDMAGDGKNNHGQRRSILLFDDEPVILDLLTLVLTKEGYQVMATPHSEDAVDLACAGTFDLAITDLGLRKKDGCYLVSKLKQVSPEIPIVATTAYPAKDIVAFAEENAQTLLPKPFAMKELLTAVRSALEAC
jgi:DNA-binding response OmpR family regulator